MDTGRTGGSVADWRSDSDPRQESPGRRATPCVLYLSYDGLLEPIGQSQILRYLEGLSRQGVQYTLATFVPSQAVGSV